MALGQGHAYGGAYAAGRASDGKDIMLNVGANPMALLAPRRRPARARCRFAVKVALAKVGGRRPLAIPQAHDQDDRELAQHIGLAAARELELRGKPPEHASHPRCTRRSSTRSTAGA